MGERPAHPPRPPEAGGATGARDPVRGAGQGFTYSMGRGLGALAPYAVGALADRYGLGASLALNSAFFLIGAILVWSLPETGGLELAE